MFTILGRHNKYTFLGWTCIRFQTFVIVVAYMCIFHCKPATGLVRRETLVCDRDTFYKVKKNGETVCKPCRKCKGGGIGWNESYVRQWGDHGYTDCFPCVECLAGTYRMHSSSGSRCLKCVLNCRKLHRYESVDCGGGTEGHCGDCLTGFRPSSSSSNSLCAENSQETYSVQEENLEERVSDNIYSNQEGTSNNEAIYISVIVVIVLLICVAFIVFLLRRCRTSSKQAIKPNVYGPDVPSSLAGLLGSNRSELEKDNDIEIDGEGQSQVRGELPTSVTENELVALQSQSSVHYQKRKREKKMTRLELSFCNRNLDIQDQTLITAATFIFGERRYELFQCLGLEEPKTIPEEEKWYADRVKFADYIHEVLKIWIKIYAEKANLKWLVHALREAGFDKAVKEILELPENTERLIPIAEHQPSSLEKIIVQVELVEKKHDFGHFMKEVRHELNNSHKQPETLYRLALLSLHKVNFSSPK